DKSGADPRQKPTERKTSMKGHVRRRGKSWCFVMDIGRDASTGRRLQRWKSGFPTRRAAEEALRRALHIFDHGGDPFPPSTTLAELVAQRWEPHLRTNEKVRARTLDGYERLLQNWVLPQIGGMQLVRVTPLHVQTVLDGMVEAGKAPRTV